jgi:hypothetical protein
MENGSGYHWFGFPPGAHFDAGLVDPDGTPRAAYFVFQRYALRQR